jgi:hypothetical protein
MGKTLGDGVGSVRKVICGGTQKPCFKKIPGEEVNEPRR